jgi:hypothetical protein
VGIVLPFASLLSLVASWRAAKMRGIRGARDATLAMLVSQLAGGVLAIIIVPLLHVVLPAGAWTKAATALLFAFGLLMPIAFAAAVWRLDVLLVDPNLNI